MAVIIKSVEKHSPAQKAGLKSGDTLISLNGNEILDVLDYRFYQSDEKITIKFINSKGKEKEKTVKKREGDEIGLLFDTYLMDKQRSCKNKCIFCFIDQLPGGMRDTLYFKDDDSRLSFLFGNYITLTNISEHEVDRIIKMHISPVNVSVHTTNPELRVKMMKNPHAGEVLSIMKRFDEAGIAMNCQLVLCPGYNDGEELIRSIDDLIAMPSVQSIAAVPVGLSKHRDGLPKLEKFEKETAAAVLDIMDKYRDTGRVFAADEFFLLADRPIPECDYYGDFLQLENGVGMWALMLADSRDAIDTCAPPASPRNISTVTGVSAYPLIRNIVDTAEQKWHNLKCKVFCVENDFFGHNITVAGLITGGDIIGQLSGKDLGDELLIPDVMLRHENDKFLDDVTVEELEKALGVKVRVVSSDGYGLIDALCE
ncbi:MAG: DUF512 domain-containing protein [Clostridia bacterium]|nr:DUF512 domain-containing protein [Clostridia bacterium]